MITVHAIPSLIAAAALALANAPAGDEPAPLPLRAAGGPQVALWQPAAHPNKPYIAQLFAPGPGPLPLLDDSPPDHFHHHGLMLALGVDDTDFWTEQGVPNAGRQQPVKRPPPAAGDACDQFLRWLAADGTPLLDESRRVRVRADRDGTVHWLDWRSTLAPAPGREGVKLWGRHYFGLGMRFLPAWAGAGKFEWPATAGQKVVRGDEKLTPGPWCAVHCRVGGEPVTLLMIDHPANPRPARWFTMAQPFCYLGATLDLEEQPARLAAGESWTLRWGIAVTRRRPDPAALAGLARQWIEANPARQTPARNQP